MMTTWNDVSIEALDYELVWLGSQARAAVGSFADVHLVATPTRRLVSGYLMLEADGERFEVSSHGHPVARIAVHAERLTVELTGPVTVAGAVAIAESGLGIVADAGTNWSVEGDTLAARAPWGITLVHGPARAKIENRIALLASLHRVGGRRG